MIFQHSLQIFEKKAGVQNVTPNFSESLRYKIFKKTGVTWFGVSTPPPPIFDRWETDYLHFDVHIYNARVWITKFHNAFEFVLNQLDNCYTIRVSLMLGYMNIKRAKTNSSLFEERLNIEHIALNLTYIE